MTLPTSRDFTILAGSSQIPANLLNNLQDQIIGAKKPSLVRAFLPGQPNSALWTGPGGVIPPYIVSTGGAIVGIPLFCETGDRITGCSFRAYGDGAVDVTTDLMYCNQDMVTVTSMGQVVDVNRAAAWGENVMVVAAHTMAVGESLVLKVSSNAANARIGRILITYDRL